jgi:plastocyanin
MIGRQLRIAAALVIASAVAAVPPGGAVAAKARVVVRMTDGLQYRPARVLIPRGGTVTWRNTGNVVHTITTVRAKATNRRNASVPRGTKPWDSGFVAGGKSYSRRFTVRGTYRYFCIPHEGARMVGTIVVR